ncbi:phage head morphogenesis protein [Candidatus Pacearchaeota archaeon]|jgi:AraC-like DNA-binding protein|nr:phage head morphogenesis protein [Candidatus Pacearchaeota archaeon]
MTPEQQVLEILQSWSGDVVVLLKRAGYFSPSLSDTAKEKIATKIGFGKGTRLYKQLAAKSEAKNWEVAKIVLTEENLIELKQGAREVARSLAIPFSEYNWAPIAQAYLKKEGYKLVKTLTATDLHKLEKQMQKHFGLNERTFERRFRENYPCSPYRTRTIFRTEKNNALNGGAHLEAKSVDATKKIWKHSHGPNPRKDHLAMDGEEQSIDAPFSNGKQYPNGDPNCRCRAKYKF